MMTHETASGNATLERDARALHRALSELVRLYQFRDRSTICSHDISVTQCYALEAVVRDGPMALRSLSSFLYLDKSTASRVVSTLERKGYVRCAGDPADGRAMKIEATKSGTALYERIERSLIDEEKRLIADFDAPARRVATTIIKRLAHSAAGRFAGARAKCPAPSGEFFLPS